MSDEARERLTKLNQVDSVLYQELSDCLDSGKYEFPQFDPSRFELNSHNETEAKEARKKAKAEKKLRKAQKKLHPP